MQGVYASAIINYLVYSNSLIYLFPLAVVSILQPSVGHEKHRFLTFEKLDLENAPFLINDYMFTYQ